MSPKPQPGAELPAGGHGKPREPQAQPCKDSGRDWRTSSPVRTDTPLVASRAVTHLLHFQLLSIKWYICDTRESTGGKTIWSLLCWTLGIAHQLARSVQPTQPPTGDLTYECVRKSQKVPAFSPLSSEMSLYLVHQRCC